MTKQRKKKTGKKNKNEEVLRSDVKKHIVAVVLFLFALIFTLSIFNQAGIVGRFIGNILTALFGVGKYALPVLMMSLGVMYFKKMQPIRYALATTGMILFFLSGLGLLHLFYDLDKMVDIAREGLGGGYIGFGIAYSLLKLVGKFVGAITLFALALIGFMLLFNLSIFNLLYRLKDSLKDEDEGGDLPEHSGEPLLSKGDQGESLMKSLNKSTESASLPEKKRGLFSGLFKWRKKENETPVKEKEVMVKSENKEEGITKKDLKNNIKSIKFIDDGLPEVKDNSKNNSTQNTTIKSVTTGGENILTDTKKSGQSAVRKTFSKKKLGEKTDWKQPKVSIFEKSQDNEGEANVEQNIEIIQRTLADFGIIVEPAGYNVGPTVTQYTFTPPSGVMLSKIVNLQSNLALSLAAPAVRVEAPIPGTSLIGIEVPNTKPTMVRLGGLLEETEFQADDSHLTIALGNDVNGNSIITSLEKMPHLLVAGSTNTGKSVCINVILSSLLFKNSPDDLQLILVDPKRVELSFYNGIPHLLTKVVVDMNKVVGVLRWATGEMDTRYKLLEEAGSKNIVTYNEKVEMGEMRKITNVETGEITEEPFEKMPYLVIVIDELADLMATHGKEVEGLIVRLSQMARAVGIHLILSTQRPDTNVITGTIKNNIPARIAFKVASQIDSRTILDRPGAEKLLGNGDMLYLGPGYPQPIRIQGPFVSESETRKLIKYIKNQGKRTNFNRNEKLRESLENKLEEKIVAGDVLEGENSDDDELYPQAKELVIQAGKASISSIQRKLRIGYNRAARIVDLLEENGVVGPENGSKPREVLIAGEQMMDEVSGPEDDMEVQAERDRREF
jgi:S-DNA-T family DNA segregation ATPase FtsK/SpoIIIE